MEEAGTVKCSGDNSAGQLGAGEQANVDEPVTVLEIDDAKELAVGGDHSCARRSDGSLWCWGSNSSGQLGDSTNRDRFRPVQVQDL